MISGRIGAIPVSLFMDVIDLGVIDVVGGEWQWIRSAVSVGRWTAA
jgi:hypothetical protein